jgi:hypothetical protein
VCMSSRELLLLQRQSCKWGEMENKYNKNKCNFIGARGSVVVKALCYKPEGRGFDTR